MSVSGAPCACVPRASKKKAATVSPAHGKLMLRGMMPAMLMPELNMYALGVPTGQKPPGLIGLLFRSAQVSPLLRTAHWNWFTASNTLGAAFRLNGLIRPFRLSANRARAAPFASCACSVDAVRTRPMQQATRPLPSAAHDFIMRVRILSLLPPSEVDLEAQPHALA